MNSGGVGGGSNPNPNKRPASRSISMGGGGDRDRDSGTANSLDAMTFSNLPSRRRSRDNINNSGSTTSRPISRSTSRPVSRSNSRPGSRPSSPSKSGGGSIGPGYSYTNLDVSKDGTNVNANAPGNNDPSINNMFMNSKPKSKWGEEGGAVSEWIGSNRIVAIDKIID